MYFTTLPDHSSPGFDEQLHFSRFGKSNVIFNARSTSSHCDRHVGCLSIKTVLEGEEWYGVNGRMLAVRPGQFLVLNNHQEYSCRINGRSARTLSIFFKTDLANSILQDLIANDRKTPEFIQTIRDIDPVLQSQLSALTASLNTNGYVADSVEELLIPLLTSLITTHQSDLLASTKVGGIKASTKKEIFKRICIARDVLHSFYADNIDLQTVSNMSTLSVPQLVRQFKEVFGTTPHRYLIDIRLQRAVDLLKSTNETITDVAWKCGFGNTSAFCRAFKTKYKTSPLTLRWS